jgi:hypothetical protein
MLPVAVLLPGLGEFGCRAFAVAIVRHCGFHQR